MKYRKKSVVVEAFQMTREARQNNSYWPEWLNRAWNMSMDEEGALFTQNSLVGITSDGKDPLAIRTLEGIHYVGWDDFIIKGIDNELYPCKPDIFEMTYEKVEL